MAQGPRPEANTTKVHSSGRLGDSWQHLMHSPPWPAQGQNGARPLQQTRHSLCLQTPSAVFCKRHSKAKTSPSSHLVAVRCSCSLRLSLSAKRLGQVLSSSPSAVSSPDVLGEAVLQRTQRGNGSTGGDQQRIVAITNSSIKIRATMIGGLPHHSDGGDPHYNTTLSLPPPPQIPSEGSILA